MPIEAIGRSIEEVYPLFKLDKVEEVGECQVRKALFTRSPTGKQRFLLTTRLGARIPIEESASPILDGDTLVGAVTIFVNISGRIASERDVASQQNRLREEIEISHLALGRTNEELLCLTGRLIDAPGGGAPSYSARIA